ncbi:MAG TPA: sensor histidine kinase [Gallionellaceae bacterium]|nr:sensor histidine kinase [Gallionellaceae bacterium]
MNKARSIKQNPLPDALPNFRNLGVTLRILLICNGLALLLAMLQASAWGEVPQRMMQVATLLAPVLLTSLLLLWLAQPWLARIPYRLGALAVSALAVALTLATYRFGGELYQPPGFADAGFGAVRHSLLALAVSAVLLMYFRWRSQVLSRALHEARLQVLRARIRPHFLFNTINAVLSIVRSDPKRAEAALEDMADLFRMAMVEPRELVALDKEVALARQYLSIEELRLGERLKVNWDIADMPPDALIPPLILQPLLENAVYHGIEPQLQGGTIEVRLYRLRDELHLEVRNPAQGQASLHPNGHKMALSNIRERLSLLFDVEAQYQVERDAEHYQVHIIIPYVKGQPA